MAVVPIIGSAATAPVLLLLLLNNRGILDLHSAASAGHLDDETPTCCCTPSTARSQSVVSASGDAGKREVNIVPCKYDHHNAGSGTAKKIDIIGK